MRSAELFEKLNSVNPGNRTLMESIAVPEVAQALKDWVFGRGLLSSGVLIGGAAHGYYARPRSTTDLDLLFLYSSDIPSSVPGFKRHRPGAFLHNSTHVEVEVVVPANINLPHDVAQKVVETAKMPDGIQVASPEGIIAMKLFRLKGNDIGDIVSLWEVSTKDFSDWPLPEKQRQELEFVIDRYS